MRLVVFDLDGTLVDSVADLADAANALIRERGGTPQPVAAIARMVGEGAGVLVQRALAAAHLPEDPARALPRFLELYDERLLNSTRLYDGMSDVLQELSAAGAAMAVLTNKPLGATHRLLDGLGVGTFFRWVIGGDGPFPRKPDPTALRHLMAEAKSGSHDTVMVGDSPVDAATARAAPARLCLARYGFGFRPDAVDLRADDVIVDRAADIISALRGVVGASPARHMEQNPAVSDAQDPGTDS